MYSQTYVDCLTQGPFAGVTDPFAEAGRYFHQIHSGMIGLMATSLSLQLAGLGYIVSKENSLQIADIIRLPDLTIMSRGLERPAALPSYDVFAHAVNADAGVLVREYEPEYASIHIRDRESGHLVTVVEVISPSNKTNLASMNIYQEERARLFLHNGVNVLEIDITASVKRLVNHRLVRDSLYHVAVFVPSDGLRIVAMPWGQPLKRIAIPLRAEAVAVDLQALYSQAYTGPIAPQIEAETHYTMDALPFPSLFSDEDKHRIASALQTWQTTLNAARSERT